MLSLVPNNDGNSSFGSFNFQASKMPRRICPHPDFSPTCVRCSILTLFSVIFFYNPDPILQLVLTLAVCAVASATAHVATRHASAAATASRRATAASVATSHSATTRTASASNAAPTELTR